MEVEKKNIEAFEKSSKGPILYIRHGKTDYNEFCKTHEKAVCRVSIQFLDCHLNEEGIKQAGEISSVLQNFKIKYVFCSPMNRCLETCLISLKNHPDKDNITIVVSPLITETVSGVHDFARNVKEKKEKFNGQSEVKFDWTLFEKKFGNEIGQEFFFLNFIEHFHCEDSEELELILKKMKTEKAIEDTQFADELLGMMSAYFVRRKQRPEPLLNMFRRNLEFKQQMADYKSILDPDEKVCVFTHSAFTKISTSKLAYTLDVISDFPEDCYRPENCEMITMNI